VAIPPRSRTNRPRPPTKPGRSFTSGTRHTHLGGRIYLVRPALRDGGLDDSTPGAEKAPVLWLTDQRTLGDHGLLLYPDGRVVAK
jgi:hypothetical protein